MKLTTRRLAFAGILAALYAVVTYLCMPFAYGSIQFRLSEALSVLCCFTPVAIVGMVVGCIVANIFTTLSFPVIDIVFGSLATFLACLIIGCLIGFTVKECSVKSCHKLLICALLPKELGTIEESSCQVSACLSAQRYCIDPVLLTGRV